MTLLVTVGAGAVGALCRYWLGGAIQQRFRSDFPIGTLIVNLSGAFLLGVVAGTDQLGSDSVVAAVGFLSGFTTFSTWMIETLRLGSPVRSRRSLANLGITMVGGVALLVAGLWLGG